MGQTCCEHKQNAMCAYLKAVLTRVSASRDVEVESLDVNEGALSERKSTQVK